MGTAARAAYGPMHSRSADLSRTHFSSLPFFQIHTADKVVAALNVRGEANQNGPKKTWKELENEIGAEVASRVRDNFTNNGPVKFRDNSPFR